MSRAREVEVGWTDPVDEAEYLVTCNVTPGSPPVFYMRNGDPGHPGDPAEVEILSVREDAPKGQKGKDRPDILDRITGDKKFTEKVEEAAEIEANDRADAELCAAEDAEDDAADLDPGDGYEPPDRDDY